MLTCLISYATLIICAIAFIVGAGIFWTMVFTRYSHTLSEQFAVYFTALAIMILSTHYANEAWMVLS